MKRIYKDNDLIYRVLAVDDKRSLVIDCIKASMPKWSYDTICDIYLVNDKNQIVGRPVLTVAVDAFSSLCIGYSLTWEGGMYSLRNLMLNVVSDKKEHCKKFGIDIASKDWNSSKLPLKIVTDKGAEYNPFIIPIVR